MRTTKNFTVYVVFNTGLVSAKRLLLSIMCTIMQGDLVTSSTSIVDDDHVSLLEQVSQLHHKTRTGEIARVNLIKG